MAKLTRLQVRELERVIYNAKAAQAYISRTDIAVARRRDMATTTLDYARPDGSVLTEVTKDYGSQLCQLSTAITALEGFLAAHA